MRWSGSLLVLLAALVWHWVVHSTSLPCIYRWLARLQSWGWELGSILFPTEAGSARGGVGASWVIGAGLAQLHCMECLHGMRPLCIYPSLGSRSPRALIRGPSSELWELRG